jgi:hypothetical protein
MIAVAWDVTIKGEQWEPEVSAVCSIADPPRKAQF